MKQMTVKYGFRLLEEREIKEVKGIGSMWLHEQSGARLFHIASEDDNKVFSVSFRTPPQDDTGLPHILEHSVLCGSRKFPLKEPFVELVKGSLNTFLNAMTFPDKTMYPVASRNDQDFRNLVDVYLDAVFYPNIHDNPWTLKQEGWHYELENLDGELTYNGVVYNEMKGVFSSPDSVLEQKIFSSLFPNTPYGKESGGDPEAIPQLTQADFEEYHRTYYHPSNSFFYLYGDMNLDKYLQFFDEEYLRNFEKIEVDSTIPMEEAFSAPVEESVEYSLSQDEEVEEKSILTLNWAMDIRQDLTLAMGLDLLCHILLETSASPLKKALQDAGIAKDISGDFQDSLLQPVLSITATFGEESSKEKFKEVVFTTLEKIVKEGLSPKLIEASLHRQEFSLREGVTGSTPKGLIYGIRAMNTWLYDGHPADSLAYEVPLKTLKDGAKKGYFENLIQTYLLDNPHRSLVIAKPVLGLTEKMDGKVAQKLAQWKKEQTPETLEIIIQETKELNQRQTAPDSEENLNTIPLLKRSDLSEKPDFPQWQEKMLDDEMVEIRQELFTSGILYSSFAFDGWVIPQEDVAYVHLLSSLLGRMDTENYKYEDLSNEVNLRSGGLSFALYSWGDKNDPKTFYPRFSVKTKALVEDIEPLSQLVLEILLQSKFTDEKRLKELIAESRARMENSMNEAGQQIAVGRLAAALSDQGAYNYIGQLPFYQFIRKMDEHFDQEKGSLLEKLNEVYKKIFSRVGLVINVTGDREELSVWEKVAPKFLSSLANEKWGKQNYTFNSLPKTEGIGSGSKVQYVAQGFNYRAQGQDFQGVYKIVETILRYDYLWNRIRVQGGAYGAAARFERSGNAIFNSYRDPNLKETLEVYQGLGEYLRNFNPGEREMTKYIIGTMSGLDTPLTPYLKSEMALSAHFSGVTVEDIQKERTQVLKAQPEMIQALAPWIEKGIQDGIYCVFGSEDKIKKQKDLFEKIISATNCD